MRWTLWAGVLAAGCSGAVPPAKTPTLAPTAPIATDDGRVARDAEVAVTDLASLLGDVAETCRERFVAPAVACARDDAFRSIAARYQARFATEKDPREGTGSIDELPRFGGPRSTVDGMVGNLEKACEHRCTVNRDLALGTLESDAYDRCEHDREAGLAACTDLRKSMAAAPGAEIDDAVTSCTAACERHADEQAKKRPAPKTKAESRTCFRGCMKECTGGRVIVAADGSFKHDEFCGTCEATCGADCDLASP